MLGYFANNCIFVTKKTMPGCDICFYTHGYSIVAESETLIMPSSILMTEQIGIHIYIFLIVFVKFSWIFSFIDSFEIICNMYIA